MEGALTGSRAPYSTRTHRMNPLGLNLRNFSVAETDSGVVGFAQLKPLTASSVELASLVILEKHRFVGV